MAASHRWFKWFLLYLHLIVVFEKAGFPKYADNPDLQWICNVCLELPTNKSDTNISIDDSNLDPNLDLTQTEGGKG